MKKLLLALLFIAMSISPVYALTVTATGVDLTVSYTEPATNVNDSLITDADHTSIYFDIGAGTVKALDVPATSINSGGEIVQNISIPIIDGQESDVSVWATSSDISGNESDKSNIIIIRIDRLKHNPPN